MIDMGGTTWHEASSHGVAWCLDLDFSAGFVYLTTAPVDVVAGGNTYVGLGGVISVSGVSESEDAQAERVTLSVPVVNQTFLAAVLGPATGYRGRRARIWLQMFDASFQPVGARRLRWQGYMEPVRVQRDAGRPAATGDSAGQAGNGRVEMVLQRAGMARARNASGSRHTHAQQQRLYPGDLGLEYMQALIEKPALWLSKKFQEI